MDLIETFSIIFRRVVVFVGNFRILWCTIKLAHGQTQNQNVADAINREIDSK